MRIIIYGAGAVGSAIGARLWMSGNKAVLIGRPAHVEAINKHGLKFTTAEGTFNVEVPSVKSPADIRFQPDDVVFLGMKGQDSEKALRDLKAVIPDIAVLCLQNGIRNEEIAARYFPRVYGAVVRVGALYLDPGEVISRWEQIGGLIIGQYPTGMDELVENVSVTLKAAGYVVAPTPDIMAYKWGKLMVNLGNAPGAITGVTGPETDIIIKAAQAEANDILVAAGIRWISVKQFEQEMPDIAQRLIAWGDMNKAWNSTWQSLARKTGTVETDFFNGEIVRLAEKIGHQAPINKELLRICLEMSASGETPGQYTPAELRRMMGL